MGFDMTRSLQERLEQSDIGRGLISAFIGATLLTLLVFQLPDSHLRAKAMNTVRPYANLVGLGQNWSVFAPDPRRRGFDLHARVTYADGSTRLWNVPRGNPFVGSYADYRWRKYAESLIQNAQRARWLPFAAWVARTSSGSGRVERIELIRRWYYLNAPGSGQPLRTPWDQYTFLDLSGPALRGLVSQ